MAKRGGRTAVKNRGGSSVRSHPLQRQPHPKAKRRQRLPWYRKPQTWRRVSVAAIVAGLVAWLAVSGPGDGGGTSAEAPFVGGDLHSLVVDPSSGRLYVGGHQGVAVSTNQGARWTQVESLSGADAMGWAFTGERVLVGGHPGLFVSEDGGRTFEMRNDGLPATDIHGLGAAEDLVYAASPVVGVFASSDGGRTWEVRTEEVGQSFMGRILVDPADPDHLIAPDMSAGAVESADGGRTWRVLGGVGGAMWVSWDPNDRQHVVVAGIGEAAESPDGGRTWTPLDVPRGASIVEMDPDDLRVMYAAAHSGTEAVVSVSRDGGATWTTP
jgi:photosystem II stability/assembly factor-like uncharacterized protein